jgi:bacterioferritin (cytochrome b1)
MAKQETMDVQEALERLNEALRLQYRSVLQYLLVSGGGRGIDSLAVGAELSRYAEAELADARLLISKIVALGGEPQTEVASLEHQASIHAGLSHLIEIEEETLAALHAVIPATGQEPGSEALEHLVEHLIMRKQNQVDFLIRARG